MVTHDIHIHTFLSSCAGPTATFDAYMENARRLGLKLVGFADHMWDTGRDDAPGFYKPNNVARILTTKDRFSDEYGVRLLIGCESEFTFDSTMGIGRAAAEQLDFVLMPHSHTHMDEVMPPNRKYSFKDHAEFMLDSFDRLMNHADIDLVTAIAHPFTPCRIQQISDIDEILSYLSDEHFRQAFSVAASKKVGLELNAATLRSVGADTAEGAKKCEFLRMFRIAKACGCKFSLGSDAHNARDHEGYEKLQVMIDLLELEDADYIELVRGL